MAKGKVTAIQGFIALLAIVAVVWALSTYGGAIGTQTQQALSNPLQPQQPQQQGTAPSIGICKNGQATTTSFTIELKNGEDTTADSTFDATGYLFGGNGHYLTLTDMTAPSAVTLNCGEPYTLKLVSADGVAADNARIDSIEIGPGASLNPSDGTVTFTPTDAVYYLKVVGSKHGVAEFRVWNVDNGAWRYASGLAAGNAWNLTGVHWNGTTSNESVITVGSGQGFTDEIHFRSNGTDTDVSDFAYWVFVTANTSAWNEPTIKLDGTLLTNNKGLMTPYEVRRYGSTYDYAYKVYGDIVDSEHVLRTEFKSLSGINPSDLNSPVVAIAPIGAYKATASSAVTMGASTDAATSASVFTAQIAYLHIA